MNENIVVKVVGGIGKKKSNKNTQWYQQDRIYSCDLAMAITTVNLPYYRVPKKLNYDNK